MFKGCRREDTAPHIYGVAQSAYRNLLTTRQDQSIVLLGKSGSGKTVNCQHLVQYLVTIAGSTGKTFSGRFRGERTCSKLEHSLGNNLFFFFISQSTVCLIFTCNMSHVCMYYLAYFCVSPSGEVAGGLYHPGGLWEQLHLHERECQSLFPHRVPGL